MKAKIFFLLASAMAVAAGCNSGSSFGGFKAAAPDSAIETYSTAFNGYTNHWQNEYSQSFRYGNLFKINAEVVDKTIRKQMIDLACDLGMPGLQMQEGFINGILISECEELVNPTKEQLKEAGAKDLLIYAEKDSGLGKGLLAKAPKAPESIGQYQEKAPDYTTIDAFVLKKGKKTVYAVVGNDEMMKRFSEAVANVRDVLGKYDMKRGWFGVQTLDQSVTCTPGNQMDVIAKGMNEGNSWFVFSGLYEFMSQGKTQGIVGEIGDPVVVDHGSDPLYGAEGFCDLQLQLMKTKEDWLAYQKTHKGYMVGDMPEDTVLPDDGYDIYRTDLGLLHATDRCDRPFVSLTGSLLEGTKDCMLLFTKKGEEFNRDKMWEAIMDRREVATVRGANLTGPDPLRKAVELLMIDRTFIEDYFGDKVSMEATMKGHQMILKIKNFHTYALNGTVSLLLPACIEAGARASETVSIAAGQTKEVILEVNPKAEAMGRMNAVMAKFDWGGSSKCALAGFNLPPAISVHQLLYGTETDCKFPVGIHNITADQSVAVTVTASTPDGKEAFKEEQSVEVRKGEYANLEFDLKLPAGAYNVTTSAMGTEATTQLGIGTETGSVTLKEVDLNGDGINEYEIENDKVKVTLLTTGARIIEYNVKGVDDNIFFKLWPEQPCDMNRKYREWGFWPYGGFEDFLGQASVETHKVYDAEIVRNDGKCVEVKMRADYYGNIIEKVFTVYGDTPLIGLRYALDFVNPEMSILGPQPILVLGKSHGTEDKFIVPETGAEGGLNTYVMNPEEMYGMVIDLYEGWNAGYDTKENLHFVGAYPVNRPYYLHMWMNLDQNKESHFPYTELQPWLPIFNGNTTFFSYYMWADAGSWENGLKELKDRNLITVK